MRDMIKSEEFKQYLSRLTEYLNDHCITLLGRGNLIEHKAAHDMMIKVITFPLVLSQNKKKNGAHPRVKECVQTAIALAETRHLKKKLSNILKDIDNGTES